MTPPDAPSPVRAASPRQRIARLAVIAIAVAGALYFGRQLPHDQTIHYVLGDGASRVAELDARWEQATASNPSGNSHPGDEAWEREATFRYAPGQAPRVVTHAPRLADGVYDVQIEIATADHERSTVNRHVTLSGGAGGSTSIDLAEAVPR